MPGAICAALLEWLATGTRTCSRNKRRYSRQCHLRGRAGCAIPPSSCQLLGNGTYPAGARSGFRPGCGRLRGEFQEGERGREGLARVGYGHMVARRVCVSVMSGWLPGPDPGGILAIDLSDDGEVFFVIVRARRSPSRRQPVMRASLRRYVLSSPTCWPSSGGSKSRSH